MRRRRPNRLFHSILVSAVVVIPAALAFPHATGVSVAKTPTTMIEVAIDEKEIRVELEATVPHLVVFNNVFPDEFRVRMGLESELDEARLRRFFAEEFVIRADGGAPLTGRLVSFETRRRLPRDEITGEPLADAADPGEQVVSLVLIYELAGRPEVLTLSPPPAAEKYPSAKIGLMVSHLGLPVMDFGTLGGEETLDLDWDDPWNTTFRNRDLRRQHDSPLNVFLVVEPSEIRIEIIVRPKDVQAWTDLGIEGRATIPVEIQGDVQQRVVDFLATNLDFAIDGGPVTPVLDRVDVLDRSVLGSTVVDPPRELDTNSATLGVVFAKPMAGLPREATVTWSLFPEWVEQIPGAVTDVEGTRPVTLQRDNNELMWRNLGTVPILPTMVEVPSPPTQMKRIGMWASWLALAVAAVVLLRTGARAAGGAGSWGSVALMVVIVIALGAGNRYATRAATVDAARASEVVSALLHNVFRALDNDDGEVARAGLEWSVSGELLTEAFLETGRGLELTGEHGGRTAVEEIGLVGLEMRDSEVGIEARCTWTVTTRTGHWGHVHRRVYQVVADLRIEPIEGVWQITGLDFLSKQRL